VVVHSAGIQDRVGARAVLMRLFRLFDTITKVFVDGGYTGKLIDWADDLLGGFWITPPKRFNSNQSWGRCLLCYGPEYCGRSRYAYPDS
jgi:hypothetical protein